jgi:hypothetical protein
MSESTEEVIGTVEAASEFDRSDKSLWISSRFGRIRFLCPRCKRGQHTLKFDDPCATDCECLCKTHYIGRDGKTKIPFGKKDHTSEMETKSSEPSLQFLQVQELYHQKLEKEKQKNKEKHL